MIKGLYYIDGVDLFDTYSVVITKGCYGSLLQYPALKTPDSNDWFEHNGIEADLSDPKLEKREISLTFSSGATKIDLIDSFLYQVSRPGYKLLHVESLSRDWNIRVSSEESRNVYKNGQDFTLKFYDDFPRDIIKQSTYSYLGHGFDIMRLPSYKIDGIDLSEYGIIVLGARKELFKMPQLKTSLEIDNSVIDGVQYDVDHVSFSSKDLTLRCAFCCDTIERFFNNYEAFLKDLVKPGIRELGTPYFMEDHKFFYKSASNFTYTKNNLHVLCEFDLTLTLTEYSPSDLQILLAAEDYRLIQTEDGLNFIDMKYYGN